MSSNVVRFGLIVFAIILVFGCINPLLPPSANQTTPITNVSGPTSDIRVDDSVSFGDTAYVDYTLYVDDKVVDTSNATLANESGSFDMQRGYAPLVFKVETGGQLLNGFVANIVGIKVNESKVFTLSPEEGYGNYDPRKIEIIPRYYNMSLFETVPIANLKAQGVNVSKGAGFNTLAGLVIINDVNSENVTLFYMLTPGQTINYNGLPQRVLNTSANMTDALIEFELKLNNTYVVQGLNSPAPITYKVINVTDTNITLDSNHRFAGKQLTFKVTLLKFE